MKTLTKLMVAFSLVSLTFMVACEKKEAATTEAPAEAVDEQPAADNAEIKPAAGESEPEAPPATQ